MDVFVDPSPLTARELGDAEMAGIAAGAVAPFVAAVIRCGAAFGSVVIAVVDVVVPDA